MATPKKVPAPIGHPNDDPAHQAARGIRAAHAEGSIGIRDNPNWSDSYKAKQQAQLDTEAAAGMQNAYKDLQARKQARLDYLQEQVPYGPNIPADASLADQAVLHSAWREAHTRASGATADGLSTMLRQAEEFGDDMSRRAALTVAKDKYPQVTRAWMDEHTEVGGAGYDEAAQLANGGDPMHLLFEQQDFAPLQAPNKYRRAEWRMPG